MLAIKDLVLSYGKSNILQNINLHINSPQKIVITGCSGSGKSSLLHIIAGLQLDYSGNVAWDGHDIKKLSLANMLKWRRNNLGFVFQYHNLLRDFSVSENVMLPLLLKKEKVAVARLSATKVLTDLGLANKLNAKISELSGGEKQRVAIARAIVHQPKIIIADEPTGSLDPSLAHAALELLFKFASNSSIIMVTHNLSLVNSFDEHFEIVEGELFAR